MEILIYTNLKAYRPALLQNILEVLLVLKPVIEAEDRAKHHWSPVGKGRLGWLDVIKSLI